MALVLTAEKKAESGRKQILLTLVAFLAEARHKAIEEKQIYSMLFDLSFLK